MSNFNVHFYWAGKWQFDVPLYMSNDHLYAHTHKLLVFMTTYPSLQHSE